MRLRDILPAILIATLPATAAAEIGRVKVAAGAAFIERGGTRQAARPGLKLERGDTLVTGRDGRIGVTFLDNSRFAAGPNSRISVERFDYDGTTHDGSFVTRVDRGSLGLVSGRIAKKNKDAMQVRTPTALLGVRGTRFVVKVD